MSRPPDQHKRDKLLDRAASVLARAGVIDTSLRSLATELGTSSRMLVYYFGTKEQLILKVLAREQQRATISIDELLTTPGALRKQLLDDWRSITTGDTRDSLRILGQVFGAACGQDRPYADYTDETLGQLTRTLRDRLIAIGMPTNAAHFRAEVTIAAIQGLVIKRFTEENPAEVDATYRQLVDAFVLAPIRRRRRLTELEEAWSAETTSKEERQPRLR